MALSLRDMWRTRPNREPIPGRRLRVGVCEGIGVRFQIDPAIARVFFVVAALFGPGVPLYLLAWGLSGPKVSWPPLVIDLALAVGLVVGLRTPGALTLLLAGALGLLGLWGLYAIPTRS